MRTVQNVRRGAATVELALCLPLLLMIILGSLEACGMIFVSQSLHEAAYEGARVAVGKEATAALVTSRCQQIITARQVRDASIRISPSDPGTAVRGSSLTITVTAAANTNNVLAPWFYRDRQIEARCTMIKE